MLLMKNPTVVVILVVLALGALGYLGYDLTKEEPAIEVLLKADGADAPAMQKVAPGTVFPVEIDGKKYHRVFSYYNSKTKKVVYLTEEEISKGVPPELAPGEGA
jgi:hypothetical protein